MYHGLCFEQKLEKYHNFHLKIIIFTAVNNCSLLHKQVIVMGKVIIEEDSSCTSLNSQRRFRCF